MGSGESSTWKGYSNQLMEDKKCQTLEIAGSEEDGATAIRRNLRCKDGFKYYLKPSDIRAISGSGDEEKANSNSNSNSNTNANNDDNNNNNSNATGDGDADANANADADVEEEKIDPDFELNSGWRCISQACRTFPTNKMFGYRPFTAPMENPMKRGLYKWDSYGEGFEQILKLGNGLRSLQLEDHSNVGIFSINRPEWMISHVANWSQNYRTVALYDTLGAKAVQYIVWHAELVAIYCEKNKLPALWDAIRTLEEDQELRLKFVIQFDHQKRYNNQHECVDQTDRETAQSFGVELFGFTEILEKGGDNRETHEPAPEDLAYIMYTSGTTGDPKGVLLTHRAFACTVGSSFRGLSEFGTRINDTDLHCSYLPLAHSFEASVITSALSGGGKVAFWAGNIKQISRDWKELRPTIMFGVPRIYNKTYDKVQVKVRAAGAAKKWLFNKARQSSMSNIRTGGRNAFYDSLVWKGVAAEIGFDRVRLLASGAAPLPPHVAEFLRVVCEGAVVSQGYGLTETCAVSFFTSFGDLTLGHVGCPVDNIEYRLVNAPECEYFVTDTPYPRGEIQMRGPTVMNGYFKNPEATAKVLAEDGWFSTGDIGRINPNGTLSIIDRRKNMFKTAMGEYVAAEKVEIIYSKAACVNQLWIYGNSFKSFVVAILVPDALWLVPVLQEQGIWDEDDFTPATPEYNEKFIQIVEDNYDTVKKLCLENLRDLEAETDLKRFEKIRDIMIEFHIDELLQGFNVDNNCLTPTFKMKRPQLLKRYVEELKELYAANGEAPNEDENW